MSRALLLAVGFIVVVGLRADQRAYAHPSHVTIATFEFDAKSKSLEASLRVKSSDLESALKARGAKRIDLDDAKTADEAIAEYLRAVIIIRRTDGKRRKLEWIGKEVEIEEAWLYFEVKGLETLEGLEIVNTIFFELEEDQVNTVNLVEGKKKATLSFRHKKRRQTVTFSKATSKKKIEGATR